MYFPMDIFDACPQRRGHPSFSYGRNHPFYYYNHHPFHNRRRRAACLKRTNSHFPNFWLGHQEEEEEPMFLFMRKRSRSADHNNKDNEKNNNLSFNVRGFKPEDVKISADKNKRTVTVSAESEEKSEGGITRVRSMRQTVRVGDDVDLEKVAAKMDGGVLRLEAPKVNNMLEEKKQEGDTETVVSAADDKVDKESDDKMDEDVASRTKDAAPAVVEKIEVPIKVQQPQEEDSFKTSVNVSGYPLSSLTVSVTDRDYIKVQGRVEEVDEEDGSVSVKEFSKEVPAKPEGRYDLENIVYKLSEDGTRLLLEAPRKKKEKAAEEGTAVPVNVV